MTTILWCAPVDIHAAHTDPFTPDGIVHGHLWRIALGREQSGGDRLDVRVLIAEANTFAATLDHTHLGCASTEDIAEAALLHCPAATMAEVEEVGVCRVVMTR